MAFGQENNDFDHNEQMKRLRVGSVLLSREALEDPNFKGTLVLICLHNDQSTVGLVINRPSHMPLSEVFDVDTPLKDRSRKIYIGGPVQQEALQILQITQVPAEGAYQVAPGVFLGGEWNSLDDILSTDSADTRLFLGYSGWCPGQLETEIRIGAWEVFSVSSKELLSRPDDVIMGDVHTLRSLLVDLNESTSL